MTCHYKHHGMYADTEMECPVCYHVGERIARVEVPMPRRPWWRRILAWVFGV